MYTLPNFPDDLLINIYLQLEIKDLIYLSQSNKYFHYYINDYIYWEWGKNKYSLEFWQNKFNTNKIISKQVKCMKYELIRIHLFQNNLKKNGLQEWNNSDFYTYWYNSKKKINFQ